MFYVVDFEPLASQASDLRLNIESCQMSKTSKDAGHTRIFLDTIIDNLPMMVTVIDARSQQFVLANKATETVFGKTCDVIGKSLHELLPKAKADELSARDRAIIKAGQKIELEHTYTKSNGDSVILSAKMTPIRINSDDVEYLLSIHEDITEKRLAENRILFMAHYDCLTGVGNRSLFRLKIKEAFECHKEGGAFALIYIDLDNFKSINDSLGHPVGDQVLISIAQRLLEAVNERHHVARLGGDEFAIILKGVPSLEAINSTIGRIISVISLPIDTSSRQVSVTASIGVAVAPDDASDADALLRNADIALYRAKKDGGNTCRFFEIDMLNDFQTRCTMENDLRDALDNNEFKLYYQPLIGLDRDRVNGFEALLRWDSPSRGLVSPADFIPHAEETGLIGSIGAWVLKQACFDAASWPDDVGIAVNISAAQFRSRSLVLDVAAALGASNLRSSRLQLEITESIMLYDTDSVIDTLRQLRSIGVKIVMDDFGTGYSSLAYLTRFAFDKVKIDQSFVRGIVDQSDCLAIVRAITGLCSSLNIPTTAEGVETDAQLQRLRNERCAEVQGYLLGRPLPVEAVAATLARYPKDDIGAKAVA